MRRLRGMTFVAGIALAAVCLAPSAAAHQPVPLTPDHSTPEQGPLLVDGTVSFAVFTTIKRGDRRGFRFRLADGDRMAIQLLIVDTSPGNEVRASRLPRLTVTDPQGRTIRLVVNERTEFYEPYGGTDYLYLSRRESAAVPGEYRVTVSGRSKREIETVIAVGYREVRGEVRNP